MPSSRGLSTHASGAVNEGDVIVTHRQLYGVVDEERRARVDAEQRLRRVREALRRQASKEVQWVPELSRVTSWCGCR